MIASADTAKTANRDVPLTAIARMAPVRIQKPIALPIVALSTVILVSVEIKPKPTVIRIAAS
jgi:hypothetical protein